MDHYCCGELGDHVNQISIASPKEWESSREFFSLDPCIAPEIVFLILNGVRTLNSCCGHGKNGLTPCVAVDNKSIKIMEKLGYNHDFKEKQWKNIFILNKYIIGN